MRLKLSAVLLVMVLSLPMALGSILQNDAVPHSIYNKVDFPPTVSSGKNITISKPYIMEDRPNNTLPSKDYGANQVNYGRATPNPYYSMYSYYYYLQGARVIPRSDVYYGRAPDEAPPATGGYWGEAPSALQRVYNRHDNSDIYQPQSGYDELKYYQRTITKPEDHINETRIGGGGQLMHQRVLANDLRARSLGLPGYVDITKVPWYVPPANPKVRVFQFAKARPQRQDQQGMNRFLPGVWQSRDYYTYGFHTYVNGSAEAQHRASLPVIDAQRIIGRDILSRAQRTLNDEYGSKYGYDIQSPPLAFLYAIDVPPKDMGSVHNGYLFKYIRDQGKLPSQISKYDADARLQQPADTSNQRDLAQEYQDYFYEEPREQEVLTTPQAGGQRILDQNDVTPGFKQYYGLYYTPNGENAQPDQEYVYSNRTSFPIPPPPLRSSYYREKLNFILQRYAFIHRGASGMPQLYQPRQDLYKYSMDYQPGDAQRIIKYQTEAPNPPAQRIIGENQATVQRTLNTSPDPLTVQMS